ncbi:ester cyclase [Litorilinea aerophila]|uniref:Ester cyclase n=1 Tax=Litorilinea aerophila TaxID=1204385 RepID=A0A540VLP5_9CHLR|nr:ester cyclase [Litorilinea aerophila]MCC9075549.1 ester cyclase [Litorilinea aerophila]
MNAHVARTMQALKAWSAQDLESYRTLYHPDAVLYGFAPQPIDVESAMQFYRAFFAAFPDVHFETLDTVAEGDRIAMRYRVTGTHAGEFQGIPATGRAIDVQGITILHFRNGKVAERWQQLDLMSLLQQLGVVPG